MSLKAELETQAAALKAYDEQDFEKALQIFETIADTSKVHTNIGLIYATLGEHEAAVDSFNAATELDQYLAIAYFQCGVSNFLLGRFEYALKDFEEALLYLRGNQNINYEQLGLKFKLHAAEVYFNKGLCLIYLGDEPAGMQDMLTAQKSKATPEHDVIDDAIRDKGEEYTVFSIPVGVVFRPSETKLRNAKAKDYLGKAKLISAADARDEFTTFTGVTRLRNGERPSGAKLDQGMMPSSSQTTVSLPPPPNSNLTGAAAKPLSRAATTAARNAAASSDPNGLVRAATTSGGMGGPARSLSVRYQNANSDAPPAANPTAGLSRSVTQLNIRDRYEAAAPVSGNGNDNGPLRSSARPKQQQLAPQQQRDEPSRLTEIYDDYLDGIGGEAEPVSPSTAERPAALQTRSDSPVTSSASPSGNDRLRRNLGAASNGSVRGGSMRKSQGASVGRNGTWRRGGSAAKTVDDEEEEGYVSGEYEDVVYGMTKLRVKIHYEDEIRGMTLSPSVTFTEFRDKVAAKFGRKASQLTIKFMDEDGHKVTLADESDYDLATEVARDTAKGKSEGKLEVWCKGA